MNVRTDQVSDFTLHNCIIVPEGEEAPDGYGPPRKRRMSAPALLSLWTAGLALLLGALLVGRAVYLG